MFLLIRESYFIKVTITLSADLLFFDNFVNSEWFARQWNDCDNIFRFNLSHNWKSRPYCVLFDYSVSIDFHLTNAILTLELSILLIIADCTTIIVCLKLSSSRIYYLHFANEILIYYNPFIFSMTLFNLMCLFIYINDSSSMYFRMTVAICFAANSFLKLLSRVSSYISVIN